jgi:hypothetical protein
MKDYLPTYYQNSKVVSNILSPESTEIFDFDTEIQNLLDQFFIDTATTGLSDWEALLGLPTDEGKPIDERRQLCNSKVRRKGTVTKDLINSVLSAFIVSADIIEHFDIYQLEVKITNPHGTPRNLPDIKNAVRELIPAHLQLIFTSTYAIFNDLEGRTFDSIQFKSDSTNRTWDEVETTQW